MPQVQLTTSQQAQIDAANKALANAKVALDSAIGNLSSLQQNMSDYYGSYMTYCAYKWSIPALGQTWDPAGCEKGKASAHPGCADKETCRNRIQEYNGIISQVNDASQTVNSKQTLYNTAKTNLDNILAAMENNPVIQGNIQENIANVQGEKNKEIIKWVIFGILTLGIIFAAMYFGTKLLTTKTASV